MKKFTLALAALAMASSAFAQTAEAPNRIFVNRTNDTREAYVLDHLKGITFGKVDGEVKADVKVNSSSTTGLNVDVRMSEACKQFKIDVIPAVILKQCTTDVGFINYFDVMCSDKLYYEDYIGADITGVDLKPGGEYAVVTIAIDEYGVEAGVDYDTFTIPAASVAGNPKVDVEKMGNTRFSFTLKVTPNDDVSEYYCVAAAKGTMENDYEMFAPNYGWASLSDCVMSWGTPRTGEDTITWEDMNPNTDYEIFIVALDVNGNQAPLQVVEYSTAYTGGHGEAKVDIAIGKYILNEWDLGGGPKMLPSLFMTFTPNEDCYAYRVGVYKKENYDKDPEACKNDVRQEPPMANMARWFQYEALTTDMQIDPSTPYVVLTAGKNIDNEWGEVNIYEGVTPDKVSEGTPAPARRGNVMLRTKKAAPRHDVVTPRVKATLVK